MRRAFFFIVVCLFATTSFASIPRALMLDDAPPIADTLSETRIRVSEVLAPFERPAESELTRALRQGYEQAGTTNASGLGRFLSVDRVITKQTLRRPQMWNRYSYVSNNPLKYVDPTGNEIRLTGCIQDANSQACKDQTSIAQQSFGKAWQYVNNNNGVLTLKAGVSPAMLGARFGASTRALAFMANSKDGFNLITGAVAAAVAKDFGGARTIPGTNGGANIYVDTSRFPQTLGGASIGAAEAFVHESGHGLESYFAGIGDINAKYAGSGEVALRGEVFPVFLENSFRRQTLGLPNNDVRVFYKQGGDIRYPGTHLEDIWP